MISLIVFTLTSLILFIAFSSATINKKLSAAEKNLKMLEEKKSYNTVEEQQLKESFDKRIEMFFKQKIDTFLIEKQSPTKTEELEKLVKKVYKNKKTYKEWEFERILICLVSFCVTLFAFVLFKNIFILVFAIIAPIIFYMIKEADLKSVAKNKDWENFIFFPDMLMSLCMLYRVGAVSSIFQGFKRISKIYDHPLIDEIKEAIKEYEFNKDKYEVLNDLADRVDFKEFTSFINLVIETEKNNIPIVETLTEYAFEISAKRKILATNQILKLPEKIDLVMYLTSTPICFVYMIMPSMLMALQQMSKVEMM